ncbi:MAG: hypothetical protein IJ461_06515, partial [Clostridia bacterium]|nr:hypothetical protein [Clostridia bacterium]
LLMCAQTPSATPALLATPYLQPVCSDDVVRAIWITESPKAGLVSMAYKTAPWPVVEAPLMPPTWETRGIPKAPPVAMESLARLLKPQTALSQPEKSFMENVYSACADVRSAPCGAAFEMMAAYLKAAAPLMQGGFAKACEFACRQWLLPLALEHRDLAEALRPVLAGLPCASQLAK